MSKPSSQVSAFMYKGSCTRIICKFDNPHMDNQEFTVQVFSQTAQRLRENCTLRDCENVVLGKIFGPES
jgi:hypothetical protein